jgi:hypothetical protein
MIFDRTNTTDSIAPSKTNPGRRRNDRADLRLLAQAERYWRSQVGTATVPRRSDIDPTGLGDALSNTMILERVAPGMARVRLAGQVLNQIFGMDVRGMPASILVDPASRKTFGGQIEALFSGPSIVEVPLRMTRGWRRRPLLARLLMLPLTDDFGQITRAMAVLAVDGDAPVGQHHRFEVDPEGAFRCTTLAMPVGTPAPRATAVNPDAPMVERRASLAPMPAKPVRRSKPLFVVTGKSDRRDSSDIKPEPRPKLRLVVSND